VKIGDNSKSESVCGEEERKEIREEKLSHTQSQKNVREQTWELVIRFFIHFYCDPLTLDSLICIMGDLKAISLLMRYSRSLPPSHLADQIDFQLDKVEMTMLRNLLTIPLTQSQ